MSSDHKFIISHNTCKRKVKQTQRRGLFKYFSSCLIEAECSCLSGEFAVLTSLNEGKTRPNLMASILEHPKGILKDTGIV